MPIRRSQQCRDFNYSLLGDHGIYFEGPIQPGQWPREHKQLFSVIREIWAIRYDSYSKPNNLSDDLRRARQNRRKTAIEIAQNARRYRFANETSWRSLEQTIMQNFDKSAICQDCKNEVHTIEYEAEPSDESYAEDLKLRREHRRLCTCNINNALVDTVPQDQDDAQPIIFNTLVSRRMTHWPLDNFEEVTIQMEPDRTIGLNASLRMQDALRQSSSTINHYPLQGPNEVLYPFLLIEAKRAVKSPGFSAMEAQTAFPLRRILLLQNELQRESKISFHPLAWFFAYQGEEWRLYAATLNRDKVRVYDLWHGTIISWDGSLQLLLIVDYIWTWARDVYRPQIRDCLYALTPSLRDTTPSTLRSLSRSQSVLSDLRSISLKGSQVEAEMDEDLSTNSEISPLGDTAVRSHTSHLQSCSEDSQGGHESDFLSQTSVRYSDMVEFFFSYAYLTTDDSLTSSGDQEACTQAATAFKSLLVEEAVAILRWEHILALEKLWVGQAVRTIGKHPTTMLKARWQVVTLRFSSRCGPEDWRILRHLECFVWDLAKIRRWSKTLAEAVTLPILDFFSSDHHTIASATVTAIRNISGGPSVLCALNEVSLTLSGFSIPGLSLLSTASVTGNVSGPFADRVQIENLCDPTFDTAHQFYGGLGVATLGEIVLDPFLTIEHEVSKLFSADRILAAMPFPKELRPMSGMLATRPSTWPATCPKFCLFVLVDVKITDQHQIGTLLYGAIEGRNYYGHHYEVTEANMTLEDRSILTRWLNCLRQ